MTAPFDTAALFAWAETPGIHDGLYIDGVTVADVKRAVQALRQEASGAFVEKWAGRCAEVDVDGVADWRGRSRADRLWWTTLLREMLADLGAAIVAPAPLPVIAAPTCDACGGPTEHAGNSCDACWLGLPRTVPPTGEGG
jgi:hypothetical protein